MRGGLDDALDRLARRDELRRRAAAEAAGTPVAVQELVEAIAAVVGRHPRLEVTVGVEGAGDPTLLHFFVEDGVVQVNADNSVARRAAQTESGPRHADFDVEPEEPVAEAYAVPTPEAYAASHDGQRRYQEPAPEPEPAENPYLHPFAATPPPPVPPQTAQQPHIRPEHHRAPEEPSAAERTGSAPAEPARGMPTPLPEPIPLHVDTEETEMAAKRLAALLRDNPSLLRPGSPD